jgi:hypothetical protein
MSFKYLIEKVLGKKAHLSGEKSRDPFSLISLEESLTLDTTKAQKVGFQFKAVLQWLEPLVKELAGFDEAPSVV